MTMNFIWGLLTYYLLTLLPVLPIILLVHYKQRRYYGSVSLHAKWIRDITLVVHLILWVFGYLYLFNNDRHYIEAIYLGVVTLIAISIITPLIYGISWAIWLHFHPKRGGKPYALVTLLTVLWLIVIEVTFHPFDGSIPLLHIVDQYGEPVEGVKLDGYCRQKLLGNQYVSVSSNTDGVIEIPKPGILRVQTIQKMGYTFATDRVRMVNPDFVDKHSEPIIIHAWRGDPTWLISEKISCDMKAGEYCSFNLTAGQSHPNQEKGDLIIRHLSNLAGQGGSHKWQVSLEVPDGGLIGSNDYFMYEAPESGYQPSIEVEHPATSANAPYFRMMRRYYLRSRKGSLHARLDIYFIGSSMTVESVINPLGGRNLYPQPVERLGSLKRAALLEAEQEPMQKNYLIAFRRYLELAQRFDDPAAFEQLGRMFLFGYGVALDYETAFRWLLKAGENGTPDSQYLLGAMYRDGEGTEVNEEESMRWFTRAALRKNPDASLSLGVMMLQGTIERDQAMRGLCWILRATKYYPEKSAGWVIAAQNQEKVMNLFAAKELEQARNMPNCGVTIPPHARH